MTKPVFKSDLFDCPSCKSKDTVALDFDHGPGEPYDTVIWCSCGVVTVCDNGKESQAVYQF